MKKAGSEYESFVENIYKILSGKASIIKNDKIYGTDSKKLREIDVSIRSQIAGHELLIIIQAKDYKNKANMTVVDAFLSVVKDVRASKGILICNKGFTKGAIDYALNTGIDLCSAHDAKIRNWQFDLKIPVLVSFIKKQFKINMQLISTPKLIERNKKSLQLNLDLGQKTISIDNGNSLKSVTELIEQNCKLNFHLIKSGSHIINLLVPGMEFQIEEFFVPIAKLEVTVEVGKNGFLKYFNAEDYRGIYDYKSKSFNHTFIKFTTEYNLNNFDDSWEKVDVDNIKITPQTLTIEIDEPIVQNRLVQKESQVHIIKKN